MRPEERITATPRSLGATVILMLALASPAVGQRTSAPADGSVLPFPPTPSASVAAPTLQESKHQRRVEPSRLPRDAPNILIVLLDDVGFGLPDTYGGPIHTPTLTRIANAVPPTPSSHRAPSPWPRGTASRSRSARFSGV